MQHLEVSCVVRHSFKLLGFKGLKTKYLCFTNMVRLRHTNVISFSLWGHNKDICRTHETVSSNGNVAKDCLPNITPLVSKHLLVFQGMCEI